MQNAFLAAYVLLPVSLAAAPKLIAHARAINPNNVIVFFMTPTPHVAWSPPRDLLKD